VQLAGGPEQHARLGFAARAPRSGDVGTVVHGVQAAAASANPVAHVLMDPLQLLWGKQPSSNIGLVRHHRDDCTGAAKERDGIEGPRQRLELRNRSHARVPAAVDDPVAVEQHHRCGWCVDRRHARGQRAQTLAALPGSRLAATNPQTIFFVLALASELRLSLPSGSRAAIAVDLVPWLVAGADPVLIAGFCQLLNVSPPSALPQALSGSGGQRQPSMGEALRLEVLSAITNDAALHRQAVAVASSLTGTGPYRAVAAAPEPDIMSTAIGSLICNPASHTRLLGVAPFLTPAGATLLPPTSPNGNLRSPLTIYLGYFILGMTRDEAGIFGQAPPIP
jgi:hypothetical protein